MANRRTRKTEPDWMAKARDHAATLQCRLVVKHNEAVDYEEAALALLDMARRMKARESGLPLDLLDIPIAELRHFSRLYKRSKSTP